MQFINDSEDSPKTIANRNTRVYKRVLKRVIPDLKNLSPQERDEFYKQKRRAYKNFVNIVLGSNKERLQKSTVEAQVDIIVEVFNNLKDIMSVIAKA